MRAGIALALAVALLSAGCALSADRSAGVYLLLGATGTETPELKTARSVVNYLLTRLNPNDVLVVASIDTDSFSKSDIIATTSFDRRPSVSNNQKRSFQSQFYRFSAGYKPKALMDISGGLLHAIEHLNAAQLRKKVILIVADLGLEPNRGPARTAALQLGGFDVVALDVAILGTGAANPQRYLERAEQWREKVESAGGRWRVVERIDALGTILAAK